ncbi:MAG: hypothetical protein P8Y54_09630 [Xanthomonadales bacterium]
MQYAEADGEVVRHRGRDAGPRLQPAVIAHQHARLRLELVARGLRDQPDGAARGVLAVQRALRAAQDLDAFDVVQLEQSALDARHVDVVQVHADGRVERLQRIGLTDAADVGVDTGVGAAALDQVQVGDGALDGIQVVGLQGLEFGPGEGADRHRHFLQGLFAPLGGDDDLLEGGGFLFPGAGRLGHHGGGHDGEQGGRQCGVKGRSVELGAIVNRCSHGRCLRVSSVPALSAAMLS